MAEQKLAARFLRNTIVDGVPVGPDYDLAVAEIDRHLVAPWLAAGRIVLAAADAETAAAAETPTGETAADAETASAAKKQIARRK
jgi:hypothetical protein